MVLDADMPWSPNHSRLGNAEFLIAQQSRLAKHSSYKVPDCREFNKDPFYFPPIPGVVFAVETLFTGTNKDISYIQHSIGLTTKEPFSFIQWKVFLPWGFHHTAPCSQTQFNGPRSLPEKVAVFWCVTLLLKVTLRTCCIDRWHLLALSPASFCRTDLYARIPRSPSHWSFIHCYRFRIGTFNVCDDLRAFSTIVLFIFDTVIFISRVTSFSRRRTTAVGELCKKFGQRKKTRCPWPLLLRVEHADLDVLTRIKLTKGHTLLGSSRRPNHPGTLNIGFDLEAYFQEYLSNQLLTCRYKTFHCSTIHSNQEFLLLSRYHGRNPVSPVLWRNKK